MQPQDDVQSLITLPASGRPRAGPVQNLSGICPWGRGTSREGGMCERICKLLARFPTVQQLSITNNTAWRRDLYVVLVVVGFLSSSRPPGRQSSR